MVFFSAVAGVFAATLFLTDGPFRAIAEIVPCSCEIYPNSLKWEFKKTYVYAITVA
jgi:hypothetical protein